MREKDADGVDLFEEHECDNLMEWLDTLTLADIEVLKKIYDEQIKPKQ